MKRIIWLAAAVALLGAARAGATEVRWVGRSDTRDGLWSAEAHFPRFTGGPVAALADRTLTQGIETAMHTFLSEARRGAGKTGNPDAEWQYVAETDVSVARPDLVSAYVTSYWYTGGAHGMTYFAPVNVGIVNGKARPLALEDLFQPGAGARWRCAEAVKARLRNMPQALWFQPDADPDMRPIDSDLIRQFVLTPTAITFLIEQYIAGPYSSGPIFVKVPYTAFGDKLNPNGPLKPLLRPAPLSGP